MEREKFPTETCRQLNGDVTVLPLSALIFLHICLDSAFANNCDVKKHMRAVSIQYSMDL